MVGFADYAINDLKIEPFAPKDKQERSRVGVICVGQDTTKLYDKVLRQANASNLIPNHLHTRDSAEFLQKLKSGGDLENPNEILEFLSINKKEMKEYLVIFIASHLINENDQFLLEKIEQILLENGVIPIRVLFLPSMWREHNQTEGVVKDNCKMLFNKETWKSQTILVKPAEIDPKRSPDVYADIYEGYAESIDTLVACTLISISLAVTWENDWNQDTIGTFLSGIGEPKAGIGSLISAQIDFDSNTEDKVLSMIKANISRFSSLDISPSNALGGYISIETEYSNIDSNLYLGLIKLFSENGIQVFYNKIPVNDEEDEDSYYMDEKRSINVKGFLISTSVDSSLLELISLKEFFEKIAIVDDTE